jgi:hypothetical protein
MNMAATERLANAIIIQAVKDYRKAYRRLLRNPGNPDAASEVKRQEKFFHSGWYQTLTDADGGIILQKIQEMEKIRFLESKEEEDGTA